MTSQANEKGLLPRRLGIRLETGAGELGGRTHLRGTSEAALLASGTGNQAPSASGRRPGLPLRKLPGWLRLADPRTPRTQNARGTDAPRTGAPDLFFTEAEWPLRQSESFFRPGPASFVRLPASRRLQGNPRTEASRKRGPTTSGCCSLKGAEKRETHLL